MQTESDSIPSLADQLRRAIASVQQAADFLCSPYFEARMGEAAAAAQIAASSPWLDRKGAAAYARCSVSEIDRAANAGAFKRYPRGGTPLFKKQEIDQAIEQGRWGKNPRE